MLKYADPGEITGRVAPTRATASRYPSRSVHRARFVTRNDARTSVRVDASLETRSDGGAFHDFLVFVAVFRPGILGVYRRQNHRRRNEGIISKPARFLTTEERGRGII